MQRSTHRLLTTHAGSWARPADLVRAKEAGQLYDHAAFAARVCTAVGGRGQEDRRWRGRGDDGEQGKPGFANYVKDRLMGRIARQGIPLRLSSD
jgi:5-methyltetrahydropteroyltriglutamate--homocysteine methyltransferase